MTLDWVDDVREALDSTPTSVAFFFRDDDVGWAGDRLTPLLDLFAYHAVPLDLAVIPADAGRDLAARLGARIASAPRLLRVHQHGFAHLNHEPTGRKCEFGTSRTKEQQRDDIDAGRRRLRDLFGSIDPMFTPPWNRCSPMTGLVLRELGFFVVSRDRSAGSLAVEGLHELPVSIDWLARRRGVRVTREGVGRSIAAATRAGGPVGIMLHHASMEAGDRCALGDLLSTLADHRRAACSLMSGIALASSRPQGVSDDAAHSVSRDVPGAL